MTEQRVAIVTGAAHGIGAGVCRRLAREGWTVVVSDIDGDAARETAAGFGGHAIAADVSREDDIRHLVSSAREAFGRIDAVISNAGVMTRAALRDTTLDSWSQVISTNLTAAFLLAREAEADLRAARGSMVLIASTRARMSEPDTFAYSASKGGLVALTHALAISVGPDIRVNCISPGWINVDPAQSSSDADHQQHPAGRVGTVEDVAGAVSFLLSSDASFMTGADLVLDGGMTRKMIYA